MKAIDKKNKVKSKTQKMATGFGTAGSVVLILLEVAQLIVLMTAITIAEMRCHNNDDLKRLLYATEKSLRRAPIAGTILFQSLSIILDINRAIGESACPGMLMTLTLPCTLWTLDLFVSLFRYHYTARATGLSTSLKLTKTEQIIDLQSFCNSSKPRRHANDGDIEIMSRDPEYVWEMHRAQPSENDTSGDKVYQCYSLATTWHMLIFMIAGSQNYAIIDHAGECSINDIEMKLFLQATFVLILVSIFSIVRAREIHVDDPEFISFRRTALSVCLVGVFAALIMIIPGMLARNAFQCVMFIITTAWTLVALTNLSPFLPELEKWAVGWIQMLRLPKKEKEKGCMGRLIEFSKRKRKGQGHAPTEAVTITFETEIKEKDR